MSFRVKGAALRIIEDDPTFSEDVRENLRKCSKFFFRVLVTQKFIFLLLCRVYVYLDSASVKANVAKG